MVRNTALHFISLHVGEQKGVERGGAIDLGTLLELEL